MKKSPQLISTSPIVLSPFLDVLTNPLLFRERGPVHDSENIQRSIDRCGNRGIFTRLSVEAFAEKDIDIGTKQGLVVILRSIPIWMGITISQSIINERRRCWIP